MAKLFKVHLGCRDLYGPRTMSLMGVSVSG